MQSMLRGSNICKYTFTVLYFMSLYFLPLYEPQRCDSALANVEPAMVSLS